MGPVTQPGLGRYKPGAGQGAVEMEEALQMEAWDLPSSWLVKQPKWEVAVVKGGQRAGKAREKKAMVGYRSS